MATTDKKITVHCCDDCGCEVDFDTGYCSACDSSPAITTALVEDDECRPASHVAPDEASEESQARYTLVREDSTGNYYVQETDDTGALCGLMDADGEDVRSSLGNTVWSVIRDLGPVGDDSDAFHAAVATCQELEPTPV